MGSGKSHNPTTLGEIFRTHQPILPISGLTLDSLPTSRVSAGLARSFTSHTVSVHSGLLRSPVVFFRPSFCFSCGTDDFQFLLWSHVSFSELTRLPVFSTGKPTCLNVVGFFGSRSRTTGIISVIREPGSIAHGTRRRVMCIARTTP
jgi:hypothetical protein